MVLSIPILLVEASLSFVRMSSRSEIQPTPIMVPMPLGQPITAQNAVLSCVDHRPWPLPQGPWAIRQQWNDLLFAHWPAPPEEISALLPPGLEIDTFDHSAWIGVVPFWMSRIQFRGLPIIPGASQFPELNLRTYVRDQRTGVPGVYFFSLDAGNPLAVVFARAFFHLPYFWASMKIRALADDRFRYRSRRRLAHHRAEVVVEYGPVATSISGSVTESMTGAVAAYHAAAGSIEHFLTARYCLLTTNRQGQILRGDIHHVPWPLEAAEAKFEVNELPAAHGIRLPATSPLLYYSRQLEVYIWPLRNLAREI